MSGIDISFAQIRAASVDLEIIAIGRSAGRDGHWPMNTRIAWSAAGAGAGLVGAAPVLMTVAAYRHAEVIRTVREGGWRTVSFPMPAQDLIDAALIAVVAGVGCGVVALVVAWTGARRGAVALSATVVTLLVPFAGLAWSVGSELKREVDYYETVGIHLTHPKPKNAPYR